MVVLDASMLLLFLRPGVAVPADRSGEPVEYAKERIEFLIQALEKTGTKIAIPTPALSEVLVRAVRRRIVARLPPAVLETDPVSTPEDLVRPPHELLGTPLGNRIIYGSFAYSTVNCLHEEICLHVCNYVKPRKLRHGLRSALAYA